MDNRINNLIESRDFWQSQADHDRKQALSSFALGGASMMLTLSGVFVEAGASLPQLAIPVMVIGLAGTYHFRRLMNEEISSAMDMQAKVVVRQHQINRLKDPDDWFAE